MIKNIQIKNFLIGTIFSFFSRINPLIKKGKKNITVFKFRI